MKATTVILMTRFKKSGKFYDEEEIMVPKTTEQNWRGTMDFLKGAYVGGEFHYVFQLKHEGDYGYPFMVPRPGCGSPEEEA